MDKELKQNVIVALIASFVVGTVFGGAIINAFDLSDSTRLAARVKELATEIESAHRERDRARWDLDSYMRHYNEMKKRDTECNKAQMKKYNTEIELEMVRDDLEYIKNLYKSCYKNKKDLKNQN